MKTSASTSPCKQYRYELRRIWDESKPLVMFLCLNPSTADAETEDNTSRVCINCAKRWGYGGLLIGNLFAYCSTDQSALYQVTDPIGPENDAWLKKLLSEAALVVCAWSDTGAYKDRDKTVLGFLQKPHCLKRFRGLNRLRGRGGLNKRSVVNGSRGSV